MIYREGEEARVWYRTDRCFRVGAGWYIATREEGDIGPFISRHAAEASISQFVQTMKKEDDAAVLDA